MNTASRAIEAWSLSRIGRDLGPGRDWSKALDARLALEKGFGRDPNPKIRRLAMDFRHAAIRQALAGAPSGSGSGGDAA